MRYAAQRELANSLRVYLCVNVEYSSNTHQKENESKNRPLVLRLKNTVAMTKVKKIYLSMVV